MNIPKSTVHAIRGLFLFAIGGSFLALTSGPSQPEFSSFEPVATNNMVSEFSGDLTYNLPVIEIPGPNDAGYALSLSYHSGTTPEEEASWVGYGWTLNPGSIIRNKRGYPDDWSGAPVTFWNKTDPSMTAAIGGSANIEFFSIDAGLGANGSIRYNNYKGFGYSWGVGVNLFNGIVSLGFHVDDGEQSFSAAINPAAALNYCKDKNEESSEVKSEKVAQENKPEEAQSRSSESKTDAKKNTGKYANNKKNQGISNWQAFAGPVSGMGNSFIAHYFNTAERPTNVSGYHGNNWTIDLSLQGTPVPAQIGLSGDIWGNFSYQANDPYEMHAACGYMYTANAASSNCVMDYHTEKSTSYNKRDVFIGIPISDPDMYTVTGEDVQGGFRAYLGKTGNFRPNSMTSVTNLYQVGAEIEIGLDNGGGAELQYGQQILSVGPWKDGLSFTSFGAKGYNEPVFFRFNNDLGGSVEYTEDDDLFTASLSTLTSMPGKKKFDPSVSQDIITLKNAPRSGRSSYIGYSTNSEMLEEMIFNNDTCRYRAYCKDIKINSCVDRSTGGIQNQIGEYQIVNADGNSYTYGLPVYARNEASMAYGINPASAQMTTDDYYILYHDITTPMKSAMGESFSTPYATAYLLTSITTPDYIDRTNDGPSDDDFGGYTRFEYDSIYGSYDKEHGTGWYNWRTPYNGLFYNRGMFSDTKDDLISYSGGEKEIYYLKEIETKTHLAKFITSIREDGLGASSNPKYASSFDTTKNVNQRLRKLDKIELYAKKNGGLELIKIVNFVYDYSLCGNVINNTGNTSVTGNSDKGKLTLRKIWFDYKGIYNATISPYEFSYEYPDTDYPEKYDSFENYGAYSGSEQNPDYSIYNLDPWGNYRTNGQNRFNSLKPWLSQANDTLFDPAAWQLKCIKLPSGGEIHVQYEQDDYCYVQDKDAHVMISLSSADLTNQKYYLDLSDFNGIDKQELADAINRNYTIPNKRIFFKFLYKLIGTLDPNLDPTVCNNEFIEGYVYIKDAYVASGTVCIELKSESSDKYNLPKQVCEDYVKKERVGDIRVSGNCDCGNDFFSSLNPLDIADKLLSLGASFTEANANIVCKHISNGNSYFKVPCVGDKKGGGIRVKRLLLFDEGISGGEPVLFGSDYTYKFWDAAKRKWRSSGVATNEPVGMREENALVQAIERPDQPGLEKIISGRDRKQSEGPIGEGLLPGPSVGYCRVVVNNIHNQRTSPGFSIKEYYTCKDFPFVALKTNLDGSCKKTDYLPLTTGFINRIIDNVWLTQGFLFKMNNMHGQPKGTGVYAGNYSFNSTSNQEYASRVKMSGEEFEYFNPEDKLPVLTSLGDLKNIMKPGGWSNLKKMSLGKETETVIETRKTSDENDNVSVEFDADVGIAGVIPLVYFSLKPTITYTKSEMYTHATTKIISYPAVVKRIKKYRDGMNFISENIAFSAETGQPLVVKTYDEYDGEYLRVNANSSNTQEETKNGELKTYSIPASFSYSNFKQKSTNERLRIYNYTSGSNSTDITYYNNGSTRYLLVNVVNDTTERGKRITQLQKGDLVLLTDDNDNKAIFNINDVSGGYVGLLSVYFSDPSEIADESIVEIEVLRSGCNNRLNEIAGTFTTYGEDDIQIDSSYFDVVDYRSELSDELNSGNGSIELSVLSPSDILDSIVNPFTGGCGVGSYFSTILSLDTSIITFEVTNDTLSEIIQLYEPSGSLGTFGIDTTTMQLVYYSNMPFETTPQYVTNLQFCNNSSLKIHVNNTISSQSSTYSDLWPYNEDIYYPVLANRNDYEKGVKGKWRKETDYAYRSLISIQDTAYVYGSGLYKMELFNWASPSANNSDNWLPLTKINAYTPDGNAVVEENILGIKSIAKYGYNRTFPYLVATNSTYEGSYFESFENVYEEGSSYYLEDGTPVEAYVDIDTSIGHAGRSCLVLNSGNSKKTLSYAPPSSKIAQKGLLLKTWVYIGANNPGLYYNKLKVEVRDSTSGTIETDSYLKYVSRVGDWALFEGSISSYDSTISAYICLGYSFPQGITTIRIDDIRFQPPDAVVKAFVYDVASKNVVCIFDDQHYGLFYQYNSEGKLVRKLKETTKGIKTIQETQYNFKSKTFSLNP